MAVDARNRLLLSTSLALTLLCAQALAVRFAPSGVWVRVALPLTIALVPLALWPQRRFMGVWVMFVGLAANLAAILANGGLMPIRYHTVVDAVGAERAATYETGAWIRGSKDVLLAPGDGRLVPLGDAIIVRHGWGGFAVSAGDLVILAGIGALAAQASWEWQTGRHRREREAQPAEGGVPTPRAARHPATTGRTPR